MYKIQTISPGAGQCSFSLFMLTWLEVEICSSYLYITFLFTLLAQINLQSWNAQFVHKQFTIRKISTISSTLPFPVLSFQFDNSLFVSVKPIRCLLKMNWRSSRNHKVSGFEIVWSYLHTHAVLASEVFQKI